MKSTVQAFVPIQAEPSKVFQHLHGYFEKNFSLGPLRPNLRWSFGEKCAYLSERGVEGKIQVLGTRTSTIQVDLQLPFLLRPLSSQIEQEVTKHLARLQQEISA